MLEFSILVDTTSSAFNTFSIPRVSSNRDIPPPADAAESISALPTYPPAYLPALTAYPEYTLLKYRDASLDSYSSCGDIIC